MTSSFGSDLWRAITCIVLLLSGEQVTNICISLGPGNSCGQVSEPDWLDRVKEFSWAGLHAFLLDLKYKCTIMCHVLRLHQHLQSQEEVRPLLSSKSS